MLNTEARMEEPGDAQLLAGYRKEGLALFQRHGPVALALLTLFVLVSGGVEYAYFPHRWLPLLGLNVAFLGGALAGLFLVRWRLSQTFLWATLAAAFTQLSLIAYFTWVGGSAELCVMILVALLTGEMILLPWGAANQFGTVLTPMLGYALGLTAGMVPSLPALYGIFAFYTMALLTVLGAFVIDRSRFEAFRQARSLERLNALQRLEHDFSETLLLVGQALANVIDDPKRLAQDLTVQVRNAIGVDWAVLYRWSADEKRFAYTTGSGVPAQIGEELAALGINQGLAPKVTDEVRRTGAGEIHRNSPPPGFPVLMLDRWKVKNVRLQLISRERRSIGLLACVYTRDSQAFSERQCRLLAAISSQAAVAMENAGLVEAVKRADRVKGEFVAAVSHELRTPLNVILGYTDLIIDGVFGEPGAEEMQALQRIRLQSMQLHDLIQGILDLNRLEARGLALSIEDLTAGSILLGVQEGIPEAWTRETVRLEWSGMDIETRLRSDRSKVEIIIRNLVHNALKYTESGSVSVAAAQAADGRTVEFSVTDTGPGIAADDLSEIFEMFGQGSSGPRAGGVGLGLYISKRLAEALGGRITVHSQLGAGARFVLSLPAVTEDRSAAA
jgi:signal transduction histidine kinase